MNDAINYRDFRDCKVFGMGGVGVASSQHLAALSLTVRAWLA